MDPDKLSRIAALRPKSHPAGQRIETAPAARANAVRLAETLGAECRRNARGEHLAVRRHFAEPCAFAIGPRAFRLLLPQASGAEADSTRWLFLDTETTGLAGGTGTYAFMVGLAWWDQAGLRTEQLFMRDHGEEPSLLLELARILEEHPVLVTFNGKSFDWPLLETRFRMARMASIGSPGIHLDLLHPARQLWRHRLQSVALSELERHVLKLDRGTDIPSDTIPGRYFEFLRGGPPEPLVEVFHHNQMDLRGLAFLALHISRLLEEAESRECEATELFGISRLLQRRGEVPLADHFFSRALAGGLSDIPGRMARRELAIIAKRNGDFERANRLWQELLGYSADGIEACEQLAIYFEHKARDFEKAVRLTRDALVKLHEAQSSARISFHQYQRRHAELQHRLNRLLRKGGTAQQDSAWTRLEGDPPLDET
jgi:uncharacterized protein